VQCRIDEAEVSCHNWFFDVGSGGPRAGIDSMRAADTKGKRPRQVPMTAEVLATLRDLYQCADWGFTICGTVRPRH
jgi:hypothetical protein